MVGVIGTRKFLEGKSMKQIKMSEEKLHGIIESTIALISSIKDDGRRVAVEKLMDELGERFFEAPASNRLDYHNCFVGGLAEHSLRVYGNLVKLRNQFKSNIGDDSVIITSLLHDVGKLGTIYEPYFIPNDSEWHKKNHGAYYTHNTSIEFLTIPQRSLRLLGQFGVDLSDEEYTAILLQDGMYVDGNKPYAHKENWLSLLLHQADNIAHKTEQEKWRSIQ
jgi:hypothetical protein